MNNSAVRQDPWSLMPRLQEEINRLFGNANTVCWRSQFLSRRKLCPAEIATLFTANARRNFMADRRTHETY